MLSPKEALEYACPSCDAGAHQRCVNAKGRVVSHVHPARKIAPRSIERAIRDAIDAITSSQYGVAADILRDTLTRAVVADDTAATVRDVLRRMRNDEQGGYMSYSGGQWQFVSSSLGQVYPGELDQLFLFADLVPDEIEPLGDCSECANAHVSVLTSPKSDPHAALKVERRERGYSRPCSSCKRPRMSNFVPIDIPDREAYGAFEGLCGERKVVLSVNNDGGPPTRVHVLIGKGVCTVHQVNDMHVFSAFRAQGRKTVWDMLYRIRLAFYFKDDTVDS